MSDQLEPELERVARMLANAGPLPDAPAGLRERALAIPDGGQAAEDGNVVPIARTARRRPQPLAWAGIAAAVAAIAILSTVVLTHHEASAGHQIALSPRSFAPHSVGKAHVVTHGDGSATITLLVAQLPKLRAGRTYEAWLGRPNDRLPLGTFRPGAAGTATVSFHVAPGEIGEYRWLWVTNEPAGGSAHPSADTALWGALT